MGDRLLDDSEARELLSVSEEVLRALLRDTPPGIARPFVVIADSGGRQHRRWFPELRGLWNWLVEVERWRGSNGGRKGIESSGEQATGRKSSGPRPTSARPKLCADALSKTSPSMDASPSTTARTFRPLSTRV